MENRNDLRFIQILTGDLTWCFTFIKFFCFHYCKIAFFLDLDTQITVKGILIFFQKLSKMYFYFQAAVRWEMRHTITGKHSNSIAKRNASVRQVEISFKKIKKKNRKENIKLQTAARILKECISKKIL